MQRRQDPRQGGTKDGRRRTKGRESVESVTTLPACLPASLCRAVLSPRSGLQRSLPPLPRHAPAPLSPEEPRPMTPFACLPTCPAPVKLETLKYKIILTPSRLVLIPTAPSTSASLSPPPPWQDTMHLTKTTHYFISIISHPATSILSLTLATPSNSMPLSPLLFLLLFLHFVRGS
ncbi:hypothetical protein O3P69_001549 [Scylla paramamosain]|uniref:Uncharacterized protein n=1 Tax=Scylla paramamosain TaxID=85552 RepID=A0AAW0UY42_SCYPA